MFKKNINKSLASLLSFVFFVGFFLNPNLILALELEDQIALMYTHVKTDEDFLKSLKSLKVGDINYQKGDSYDSTINPKNYYTTSDNLYISKMAPEDVLTLEGEGQTYRFVYQGDGNFAFDSSSNSHFMGGSAANGSGTQPNTIEKVTEQVSGFDRILTIAPKEAAKDIEEFVINTTTLNKVSSKIAVSGDNYFLDVNNGQIYLFHSKKIFDGDVIKFKKDGNIIAQFKKQSDGSYELLDSNAVTQKDLHIRLEGTFEPAVLGQTKIDAVTAATGQATSNKNSNVSLYVAESLVGTQPQDSDFVLAKDSPNIRMNGPKCRAIIDDTDMGMIATYNAADSSVTLRGTPKKAGTFKIHVEIEDTTGRKATSNPLTFKVYDQSITKLKEQLVKDNFKLLPSGDKYQWDMVPWYIELFAHDDKNAISEVSVPRELKLWHGSHESGTYGVLGYPVQQGVEPVQTLVVDSGTTLVLRHMKVLSSVNILVKNGGKLNFYDSSLYGKITVQDGGIFQMNYDEFQGKHTTGSSINGQLVLKDGAILESSTIYSNANSLTDGKQAKRIDSAVVKVEGNVQVRGKVYIRGDEAPTGTSAKTGKQYAGQPAMEIAQNATLDIKSGSQLGLYGGGKYISTTNGGDALILNQGSKVTGDGKLIAVGGDGAGFGTGKGGDGVSGTGYIDVAEVFLQGGNTNNSTQPLGRPHSQDVVISDDTVGYLRDGLRNATEDDKKNSPYWVGTQPPGTGTGVDPLANSSTVNAPTVAGNYVISGELIGGNATVLFILNGKEISSAKQGEIIDIVVKDIEEDKILDAILVGGEDITSSKQLKMPDENVKVTVKLKDVAPEPSVPSPTPQPQPSVPAPANPSSRRTTTSSKNRTTKYTKEEKTTDISDNDKTSRTFKFNLTDSLPQDIRAFVDKDSNIMLPVRFVAENLSMKVEYDHDKKIVTLSDENNTTIIRLNSTKITVNGKDYTLDKKPLLKNNRTFLTIEGLAKALELELDKDIIYNKLTGDILITR